VSAVPDDDELDERRRLRRRRLIIWVIVFLVLFTPIPGRGGVWYLNGLLFRFFDWVNARLLPENF